MALSTDELSALVDLDRGTVAGRAFSDDDIYEIELERVFARAWFPSPSCVRKIARSGRC